MRLIDADSLKEWVEEYHTSNWGVPQDELIYAIGSAQTIDPVKHGKWLPHPTEPDWDVCSVCGIGTHRRFHYNDAVYGGYDVEESFTYCPHCGASMDGGEDETDRGRKGNLQEIQ